MKKFIYLLMAASLTAFACFAISFWLIKWDYQDSLVFAISIGIAGLVVELLKPYLLKQRRKI